MTRSILVCGSLLLVVIALRAGNPDPIRARAVAFVRSLPEAKRKRATAPLDAADRERWHYVPKRRAGVALKELDPKQRTAFDALLGAALSKAGHRKARGVLTLEGVLVELGADPRFRDAGAYFIRVFGDPGGDKPWGFSFEGHHLSLNYTSQAGVEFSGTPAFFGANPHRVLRGRHEGLRVLGDEEDLARKLLETLDKAQLRRARIAGVAPREIVTGARSRVRLESFDGIPASELDEAQRKQLRAIIELYARNHKPGIADALLRRIDKAGAGKVCFAWAGSAKRGEPHYYRIHGPTFVIEYVNVQNDANHSHTVLREFGHDFGRDWLAEHFARDH